MGRRFYSSEETSAYREGRNDRQHHKRNIEYDKFSDNDVDKAYFLGRKDEEDDERMREEERMLEEEEERQERLRQERMEYEKYLREQEYYDEQFDDDLRSQELEEMFDLDIESVSDDNFFNDIEDDDMDE